MGSAASSARPGLPYRLLMRPNERLRMAMLRAGIDSAALAESAEVDVKTVQRWVAGRTPHRRARLVVAETLGETEATLWPITRPDLAPGSPAASEVVGAYAHRSDVPQALWTALLSGARRHVDLLGYAYPFLFESDARLVDVLRRRCAEGMAVRIALADPDCQHVAERDTLEQLGGTLTGRIRNAMRFLVDLEPIAGVTVGLHTVHLYNSMFRFDDQMVVTPHLFRARGYQHPALHLRKCSPYGIFASFEEQFEQVWQTTRPGQDDRGTD